MRPNRHKCKLKLKSKKIYLIRHGQTEYNKHGMVQGSGIDAPLNETGYRQATAFFKAYGDISFDKIYISTLQRTRQSVQSFLDLGIPYEKLSGLNEINWGEKEGMPISKEDHDYYLQVTSAWENGQVDLGIAGGESPVDVRNRQKVAMDHILTKTEEKTILICMHGRAMRILLCELLNYHLKHMDTFPHSNLGLYKINYSGNHFSIEWTNDTRHLNGFEF